MASQAGCFFNRDLPLSGTTHSFFFSSSFLLLKKKAHTRVGKRLYQQKVFTERTKKIFYAQFNEDIRSQFDLAVGNIVPIGLL
jgi:hypothetical protein